jgi:Archaea-specific editing domain of threonyl-tRNA synthetase
LKLLMFQAKRFRFRTFEKTLEKVPELDLEEEIHEAAVIFLQAEVRDQENLDSIFSKTLKNIKWLANKRGLKKVVLHSFTHLGGETADPEFAQAFLERLAERLRGTGYQVWITPFGYVCEWDLSVYGESLAKVFKAL